MYSKILLGIYQKRLITFYASGKITWLSSGLRQLGQLWGVHGDFETISKRGVAKYVESPVFPKLPSCHPHSWGFLGQHYSTGIHGKFTLTRCYSDFLHNANLAWDFARL